MSKREETKATPTPTTLQATQSSPATAAPKTKRIYFDNVEDFGTGTWKDVDTKTEDLATARATSFMAETKKDSTGISPSARKNDSEGGSVIMEQPKPMGLLTNRNTSSVAKKTSSVSRAKQKTVRPTESKKDVVRDSAVA